MVDPALLGVVPALNGVPFNASVSSSAFALRNTIGYAVQFVWSGATSASGSLVISGSNDDPTAAISPGIVQTWTPVTSVNVNTNSGNILVNVERAMYSFVQVSWVRTAGTGGSLTAKLSRKNA